MAKERDRSRRFWLTMLALLGFSGASVSAQQPPKAGEGTALDNNAVRRYGNEADEHRIMVMYGAPTMNFREISIQREIATLKEQVRRKRIELRNARKRLQARRKAIRQEQKRFQNRSRK